MKCIVLAAGYATRLYPLTENFPKPLLKVGGKTIIDWLLDDIHSSDIINEFYVVTNDKFYNHFFEWKNTKNYDINIINDGTSSNETRLGAVADIKFVKDNYNTDDDVLIIAGDNVLDFSLCKFIDYFISKKSSCVMRYFEDSFDKLKKCGVLTVGNDDIVLNMVEKPDKPESHYCCPPFYIYTKNDFDKIDSAIIDGCGIDAPGSFVSWLCKNSKVYAMEMPGNRYDIGNLDGYNRINNHYKGITVI